ncbi:MAG: sugar ABC transporter ATP-binding protein [Actinomycetota bacterium]
MDELTEEISSGDRVGDAAASPTVLSTVGLTKVFSGVRVVDDANVTFRRGQIHGLVGQNGAGKSSLVKMVCGVYRADEGHLAIDGAELVFTTPRQARDRRVTLVAQELSLVPALSVAENILLGRQPSRAGLVNGRALRRRALELIESFGFGLDPDAIVSTLAPSDQQKVEILRALASDAGLIVLDEPTSSMSIDDSTRLYEIIRLLADRGTSVVLVSHFLDEVLDVCDVVTVMRDGEVVVHARPSAELTTQEIVHHMVGDVEVEAGPETTEVDRTGTPRLKVDGLSGNRFTDMSVEVHPGEIVAMVGLVGSGRTEFLRGVFGVDATSTGTIELNGERVRFRRPADAVKAGVAMVTESRKLDGIFPVLGTSTNIAIAQPGETSAAGIVRRGLLRQRAGEAAERVNVQAASLENPITSLSGGNQQKALLARWLLSPPQLYLIDEPTRGVDVVSIQQIHGLLKRLTADGMSVLMVTSEFDEALALAHRIYVVRNGRIVRRAEAAEVTKPMLLAAAFGTDAEDDDPDDPAPDPDPDPDDDVDPLVDVGPHDHDHPHDDEPDDLSETAASA